MSGRPKCEDDSTHGAEGGDFLDALLIVRDFVPWRALLAEPEYPAARAEDTKGKLKRSEQGAAGNHDSVRTYVFRRGCTDREPLAAPFPAALSLPWAFSSPGALDTKVEKCLEDVTRERGCTGGVTGGGFCAVVVVVVVVAAFGVELARKRDWEWLEK